MYFLKNEFLGFSYSNIRIKEMNTIELPPDAVNALWSFLLVCKNQMIRDDSATNVPDPKYSENIPPSLGGVATSAHGSFF
jgi:hypothetical protein